MAEKSKPSMADVPIFRIVTGSYEHNLLCVSLALYPGAEVFTPIFHFTPHTQSIRCLAYGKRYLTSGSNDEHIRLYDLQKRKELGTLLHHAGSITTLRFFDKWLLSGAGDGKICIWRTKDWEVLGELKGHKAAVNDIAIHPTGRLALSVADDRSLRLWNLMTAKKASVIKLRENALHVRWSLDGTQYVVGYSGRIEVYGAESAKLLARRPLKSSLQHMDVVDFGEGEFIATSHNNGQIVFKKLESVIAAGVQDKAEDVANDETTIVLQGHGVRVKQFDLYFHEHNKTWYMASVSSDGKIVAWDLAKRDQVGVYKTADRLNCVAIVPDSVEKYDTMKKRAAPEDDASAAEETEFSEADSDAKPKSKKAAKSKKKKAKVVVEVEK